MKRVGAVVLAVVVVAVALLIAIGLNIRDPEVSNPADIDDMPDSYASDPKLFEPGPHRIQEQLRPSAERSTASTPYFIELADGRYSCGYTDLEGNTHAVFTQRPIAHQVFWDDEAWTKWLNAPGRRGGEL